MVPPHLRTPKRSHLLPKTTCLVITMMLYGAKAYKPTAHTIDFKWSIAYGGSEGTLEEPLPFPPARLPQLQPTPAPLSLPLLPCCT